MNNLIFKKQIAIKNLSPNKINNKRTLIFKSLLFDIMRVNIGNNDSLDWFLQIY
jgi:hypothetical protein